MATYSSAITQTGVRLEPTIIGGLNALGTLDFSSDQNKYMLIQILGYQNTGSLITSPSLIFQFWDSFANTWRNRSASIAVSQSANRLVYAASGDFDDHLRSGNLWAGAHYHPTFAADTPILSSIIFPGERLVLSTGVAGTIQVIAQTTTFRPAS